MFTNRLKELRKEKQLTQENLAKILGFRDATISQYESGKRTPDQGTLQKLADFFEVSVDYLLGRTDIKENFTPEEIEILQRIIQDKRKDDTDSNFIHHNPEGNQQDPFEKTDSKTMNLAKRIKALSEKDYKAIELLLEYYEQKGSDGDDLSDL